MAFILRKKKAEPYWLDLPYGVRARVRPLNTGIWEAALYGARKRARDLMDAVGDVEGAGGVVEGMPDLQTTEGRHGFIQANFVASLARQAILEWTGFVDEEKQPVPVTPEAIEEAMAQQDFSTAFLDQYSRDHLERITEGNGLPLSPNGTSVGGGDTATTAQN